MFAYALHTNAGDAEAVKQALQTIVPHAHRDHSQCSETWCGYLKAPATYKHSGLPRGKDLTCPETRRVLTNLFGGLAAQAAKLAPLGSSQAIASFNNIATSKAPKTRHFGGSDSQDFPDCSCCTAEKRWAPVRCQYSPCCWLVTQHPCLAKR